MSFLRYCSFGLLAPTRYLDEMMFTLVRLSRTSVNRILLESGARLPAGGNEASKIS